MMSINGILLLDKPAGMTSNGVLQKVKRLFNAKKAGHTGSLDPIATGMLPICFGEGTKFSQFLLDSDKYYQVVAKLGVQTTTGDREGEVIATQPVVDLTSEKLEEAILKFLGEQTQIPPMYSAIKHQGKPLYQLARRGIEIERAPRRIHLYSLKLNHFHHDTFELTVHCSKGTYIRTLVEDIGKELGYGCHVLELRRTQVAPYVNFKMYSLSNLEHMFATSDYEELTQCLLPIDSALSHLPSVKLSTSAIYYLRTGQAVQAILPANSSLVRLISEDAQFIGIGETLIDGRIKPYRLVSVQS